MDLKKQLLRSIRMINFGYHIFNYKLLFMLYYLFKQYFRYFALSLVPAFIAAHITAGLSFEDIKGQLSA